MSQIGNIIYTHDEFIRDIQIIIDRLQDIQFKPDVIVGLSRGGAVPAIYLSHRLDCACEIIKWNTQEKDKIKIDRLAVQAEQGRKVFIIDDIVDSGLTIQEIKDRTVWGTRDNIKYGAIWFNPNQQNTYVHLYVNTIDRSIDNRYVIFPWETLV